MIHLPLLLLLDAGGPHDDLSAALLSLETVACALPDALLLLESITDDLFDALAAAGDRRLGHTNCLAAA